MSRILVVAEHLRGHAREITYELITAASALGGSTTVAVIAHEPTAIDVDRVGVDEVVHILVDTDGYDSDVYRVALETLVRERKPDVVLCGFTVDSMGFAPAVAAKLGLGFGSDIFDLRREDGHLVAMRAFYGGKVHAELEFPPERPALLLLRPTVWPQAAQGGTPTVSELALPPVTSRLHHREYVETPKGDVDIAAAPFLLSIGRAVEDAAGVAQFQELADRMGATLAASRPLVDQGLLPASRQVGQSGTTVQPKVYLAFGISGAVQHLAGMKNAETVVAVNLDPEAPIFEAADYGAVADIFDVAEELAKTW
jgi:electron transfer flavoprotein alpha subunit